MWPRLLILVLHVSSFCIWACPLPLSDLCTGSYVLVITGREYAGSYDGTSVYCISGMKFLFCNSDLSILTAQEVRMENMVVKQPDSALDLNRLCIFFSSWFNLAFWLLSLQICTMGNGFELIEARWSPLFQSLENIGKDSRPVLLIWNWSNSQVYVLWVQFMICTCLYAQ
jgi:hypothetical protein